MFSRITASILCTSLLAIVPASASARAHPSRACSHASTPATLATNRTMRTAVLCLINKQRSAHQLPALRDDARLDRSAESWTQQMVLSGIFGHGADFASRITAVGLIWRAAGENIATGYATPTQVVSAWMASKDHCQNILDPSYVVVGTGISRRAVGSWASAPSTWTQDFALPLNTAAPSTNWGPSSRCPY